jgi:phosphoribosylformylglycinamidine cyclo-ligase
VGEALLTPTRLYTDVVMAALAAAPAPDGVTGIAHITGGGLQENVDRLLPENLRAEIDHNAWTVRPVFNWLQRLGGIETAEMRRVFNMGIGLVFIVRPEAVKAVSGAVKASDLPVHTIGVIA